MTEQEGQPDLVTFIDDEGHEHAFFAIDSFTVGSKQYAVLVPIVYNDEESPDDDPGPDEEAYIFRIDKVDGEEVLREVEEEEEWAEAAREYEIRRQAEEEDSDLL